MVGGTVIIPSPCNSQEVSTTIPAKEQSKTVVVEVVVGIGGKYCVVVVVVCSCCYLKPNEKPNFFSCNMLIINSCNVKTKRGTLAPLFYIDYFLIFNTLIISRYLLISFFFK